MTSVSLSRRMILCFLLLLAAGCVNAHARLTLHVDGSGTYEYKVVSNELILSRLEPVKNRLRESGYRIIPVTEKDLQGWIAVKEVENIVKEPPGTEFREWVHEAVQPAGMDGVSVFSGPDDRPLSVRHDLLFTTVTLDKDVDLTRWKRSDLFGLEQLLYDRMNLKFILSLPVKPDDHNATSASDDGRTLTWNIRPGEHNRIWIRKTFPNPFTWGGVLILAITAGTFFLIRAVRKRRNNE
ncbi:DUF3153 domain-containing protein [Staphylospora marina]|uniref:DUF3153 domain-containing protein n=1 Tax=Staphylospora marina TaxID=2490858 RepID=UPI0013DD9E73|nr:DUF3153 domain-containing protein [Staphylospora marina]